MNNNYKRLNLGCGESKKKSYINVDFRKELSPDIVHDLNIFPYPFENNYFDLIEAFHVLEHLDKPFLVMRELHRILKPGGKLHIKVPHFSRGFTHSEHKSGFDLTFPFYFNNEFTTSGYLGVDFEILKTEMHWAVFFHLMPFVGASKWTILTMKVLNAILSFLANLHPGFCSRIWCFLVGGFEEIEFIFTCKK